MKEIDIGCKLRLHVVYAGSIGVRQAECEVCADFGKFVVLTNGKYRFCAFRADLERKELIVV